MKKLLSIFVVMLIPTGAVTAQGGANFEGDHYASYRHCMACHRSTAEGSSEDIGAPNSWLPSMMSNAYRDPLWQAKVETEMNRNAELRDVLDKKCSHCHGPIANTEASQAGEKVRIFDYNGELGLNNPKNPRHFEAMEGITCTVCHQMTLDGTLEESEWSGNWSEDLETKRGGTERKLYGNIEDPTYGVQTSMAGYGAEYNPAISTGEACGVCHEIRTPIVNIDTKEINPTRQFVEQSTYTEWENSSFGSKDENQTCQDCHMPPVKAVSINGNPKRDNFHVHTFVGANTSMLDLLKRNRDELGLDPVSTDAMYDRAVDQTRQFLKNETVALSVESSGVSSGNLEVKIKVVNKAGHKFPTGIQARRGWINFVVKDVKGNVVFESGRMNEDGSIVGADSDSGKGIEDHHDTISSSDQVQIYEGVMKDTNGDPTFTILFADGYYKDNRLLPRGYREHSDTHVYGAATKDKNYIAGSDEITYSIPNLPKGKYTVEAKLMFQALGKPFMNDLFRDETPAVLRFKRMYDQPELIQAEELQSVTVDVTKG
ncbi:hypothetical protein ACFL2V_03150 [Pseudomonadota bacterium]